MPIKEAQVRLLALSLKPFIDATGLLQVGGRQQNARFTYNSRHPIILHSKHPLVKIMIRSEHVRLFHGGSLVVSSSLFRDFHIVVDMEPFVLSSGVASLVGVEYPGRNPR
jgi:hypothetical protein